MSALFRVWAAESRAWLRAEGVLPPPAQASAERRATEFALTLDLSEDEVAGLAVDWPKCYDRGPLATVEAVAGAARMRPAVWRPVLAASAMPRRVRVDGLAGPLREPLRGLAPGCPAATPWLGCAGTSRCKAYRRKSPRATTSKTWSRARARGGPGRGGPRGADLACHPGLWPLRGRHLNEGKCVRLARTAPGQITRRRQPGPRPSGT